MKTRATIDAPMIERCRELAKRNPSLKQSEIGAIVGCSDSTVSKIMRGDYDWMLADRGEEEEAKPGLGESILSGISERLRSIEDMHAEHLEVMERVELLLSAIVREAGLIGQIVNDHCNAPNPSRAATTQSAYRDRLAHLMKIGKEI